MNDNGGTLVQQNIWTTFAKAEIRCPSSKKLPYNIIQDIFALTPAKNDSSNEILFYGIFTSQWPESLGKSAVCVFRMNDIKAVFTGGYLKFNKDTQRWNRETRQDLRPGTCEQKTDNTIFELKDIYLMDSFIRPVGHKPILESYEHLYTKITVQRVKAANMKTYIILFLLTASGSFHKVVMEDGEIRFNETIQLFTEPQPVTNLLLSAEKASGEKRVMKSRLL
ncbi:semaphorin-4B-like [Erpetoichthys calabaricus]|uniref:semaphorin-4B-like n=1 Tax=Erpetoichthys calabaricus TaxID=27687 RepID=UPI00223488E0|nr:semaphorin-4B-like [Erpetoichthys calabaricus]